MLHGGGEEENCLSETFAVLLFFLFDVLAFDDSREDMPLKWCVKGILRVLNASVKKGKKTCRNKVNVPPRNQENNGQNETAITASSNTRQLVFRKV